jgi:hypothetical protein
MRARLRGSDTFGELNPQLTCLFFHNPTSIKRKEEEFADANLGRDFTEVLKAEIAQAFLQIRQANLFSIPPQ